MSIFREIAKGYAQTIMNAAKQTELERTSSVAVIKQAFSERDPLLEAIKSINFDLDRHTCMSTDKHLFEDDKRRILVLIGDFLGLSEPYIFFFIVREAENENAYALLTYMGQFIGDLQNKTKVQIVSGS
jgi:hypothetical protein